MSIYGIINNMKAILKRIKSEEKGAVFLLALILLAVGSIILVPLLSYMSTGLVATKIFGDETKALYAADAGVEDAIWRLTNDVPELPDPNREPPDNYNPWVYSIADVNGRSVALEIWYLDGTTYRIVSQAPADGSGTTITALVQPIGYWSDIMDNAVTSPGDVTIKPGVTVEGDVQYNGDIDNKGEVDGTIYTDPLKWWPTAGELSGFYQDDLDNNYSYYDIYTGNIQIDLSSVTSLGPLLVDGNLLLKGSGSLTLAGTILVTGNLTVNPLSGASLTLNNQTIYAGGSILLSPGCTTIGSGCVIAAGDVDYQPNISGDDFVFLMSLEGVVTLQPGNDFYGSIAGECEVNLWPGTSLIWTDPPIDSLNFPPSGSGPGMGVFWGIRSWEIS